MNLKHVTKQNKTRCWDNMGTIFALWTLCGRNYVFLGRYLGLLGHYWGSLRSSLGALGLLFGVLGSLFGALGALKGMHFIVWGNIWDIRPRA